MIIPLARVVRLTVVASLLIGGATRNVVAQGADVVVASGELDGQFLADSLFHVGEFWMRVTPHTEFHRWLSQGIHRNVVIRLTTNPARFADARDERMLAGTLIDETAPNPTPMTTDVTGRLPEGNMPMIHILFLKDERSGSLGTVTFQTADYETAGKFSAHGGANVGIIIKLE